MVAKDMRQMRRHGLPLMTSLLIVLFFVGLFIFGAAGREFDKRGVPTWTGGILVGVEESSMPFTLLEMTFGYAVLVTMIFISVAFATGYNHEMKKGTVRTLLCYPIGVLGVTVAKLLYAALAGLIFAGIAFFLPTLGIGKPVGEVLLVFLTAYILSLATVTMGVFIANILILTTRRMYIRPTSLPFLLVVFSLLFTRNVLKGLTWFLHLLGMNINPDSFAKSMEPLTNLSPYHQGGAFLSVYLGGSGSPMPLIFLVYATLLVLAILLSTRLYPSIYEKE